MKLLNRITDEDVGEMAGCSPLDASPSASPHSHPAEHLVQFYENDDQLARAVANFFDERLSQGASAIFLATPQHRAAVERHLRNRGHSLPLLSQSQRYCAIDAELRL